MFFVFMSVVFYLAFRVLVFEVRTLAEAVRELNRTIKSFVEKDKKLKKEE